MTTLPEALSRIIVDGSELPDRSSKSFLGSTRIGDAVDPLRDLPTPALTVDLDTVTANIVAMSDWVAERGVLLAPHGKTTMAPALWRAQLAAGAMGITVAHHAQARIAVDSGAHTVVIANEVIAPPALAWLVEALATHPELEVICWVDSIDAVTAMATGLARIGADRPVSVCVELGIPGARTGLRDDAHLADLVTAVTTSRSLRLVGVAGYEGVMPGSGGARLSAIEMYLDRLGETFEAVAGAFESDAPILTAGGSDFFDVVVERLKPHAESIDGGRLVLRSGAYVLHDDIHYHEVTPAATRIGPRFGAAATLWARVLSTPEPALALIDAGKRDLAYDLDLPVVRAIRHLAGSHSAGASCVITAANDQHSYLSVPAGSVEVGALVELGQSHPCTMFDKWRDIPLTTRLPDGRLRLDGALQTYF